MKTLSILGSILTLSLLLCTGCATEHDGLPNEEPSEAAYELKRMCNVTRSYTFTKADGTPGNATQTGWGATPSTDFAAQRTAEGDADNSFRRTGQAGGRGYTPKTTAKTCCAYNAQNHACPT